MQLGTIYTKACVK